MPLFNMQPRQMPYRAQQGPRFRRPAPPRNSLFGGPQRQMQQGRQGMGQKANNFMSAFTTEDGNMDFGKISQTFSQMHGIYGQVKPMISPLISRFMK